MIVKDEEATLGAVLDEAATICDELVIVDTGSTDLTVDIAKKHGARVIEFRWIDDFAAARNVSFDACLGDWILWLDADDRIPPDAQAGFAHLKVLLADRSDIDGVMIPYHRAFSQVDPSICTFSFDRERVLRRRAGLRWFGRVHEVISNPAERSMRWPDAWVEHRPPPESWERKVDRNLRILENAFAEGDRSPRTLFYLGNELRDHRRWGEALGIYREYVECSDVMWEKHAALLSMAQCAEALELVSEKVQYLFAAVSTDPTRAEAFVRLGRHFYDRQEWSRAIPFLTAATSLQRPTEGFVDDGAYEAAPWDFLAICLSHLDRYEEALEVTLKALLTSDDRQRLMDNLGFYLDQLKVRPSRAN